MERIKSRVVFVFLLVAIIAALQYITDLSQHAHHMLYQGLFFIPIILSGIWFGLKGTLITSLSITMILVPFTFFHWRGLSAVGDLNNIVEMILYNLVAVILGKLKDREVAQQKRLQETEGLAVLGRAVSGLAHDLRTPLIGIGGMLRLMEKHLVSDHEENQVFRKKLDIALGETQRLDNMVKDMLDFSRPLELHRTREGLAKVVEHSFEILCDLARKKRVTLRAVDVRDAFSTFPVDHERMEQALINLLKNAIEASPEGETVTVRCSRTRKHLIMDVVDRGEGISSERREEIFIPFFTTKSQGTGLGLPVVRKIVEAHHGRIEIIENSDKGLTFRMIIPPA